LGKNATRDPLAAIGVDDEQQEFVPQQEAGDCGQMRERADAIAGEDEPCRRDPAVDFAREHQRLECLAIPQAAGDAIERSVRLQQLAGRPRERVRRQVAQRCQVSRPGRVERKSGSATRRSGAAVRSPPPKPWQRMPGNPRDGIGRAVSKASNLIGRSM
jgi:hypothetical protein